MFGIVSYIAKKDPVPILFKLDQLRLNDFWRVNMFINEL